MINQYHFVDTFDLLKQIDENLIFDKIYPIFAIYDFEEKEIKKISKKYFKEIKTIKNEQKKT